jgi:hypothetical protein
MKKKWHQIVEVINNGKDDANKNCIIYFVMNLFFTYYLIF